MREGASNVVSSWSASEEESDDHDDEDDQRLQEIKIKKEKK